MQEDKSNTADHPVNVPSIVRRFCRYCGRPMVNEAEFDTIEPEGGIGLCWREWGGDCLDIEDAFERVWKAAIELAECGDPKPWLVDRWKEAKKQILQNTQDRSPNENRSMKTSNQETN